MPYAACSPPHRTASRPHNTIANSSPRGPPTSNGSPAIGPRPTTLPHPFVTHSRSAVEATRPAVPARPPVRSVAASGPNLLRSIPTTRSCPPKPRARPTAQGQFTPAAHAERRAAAPRTWTRSVACCNSAGSSHRPTEMRATTPHRARRATTRFGEHRNALDRAATTTRRHAERVQRPPPSAPARRLDRTRLDHRAPRARPVIHRQRPPRRHHRPRSAVFRRTTRQAFPAPAPLLMADRPCRPPIVPVRWSASSCSGESTGCFPTKVSASPTHLAPAPRPARSPLPNRPSNSRSERPRSNGPTSMSLRSSHRLSVAPSSPPQPPPRQFSGRSNRRGSAKPGRSLVQPWRRWPIAPGCRTPNQITGDRPPRSLARWLRANKRGRPTPAVS